MGIEDRGLGALPLYGFDNEEEFEREWVVSGLLASGETSLLIAPPFGGKSALLAHVAVHVAAGRSWFGRPIVAPGPTLIIAGERLSEMRRRVAALAAELGVKPAVMIASGANLDLCARGATVRLMETVFEFEQHCGEPPALIGFDTLAALTPGADEISAADMTTAMQTIRSVAERFSAHALVVHHCPLDNPGRSRGHSSIDGAADVLIGVERGRVASHRWRVMRANAIAEPLPFGEYGIGSHQLASGSVAIARPASITTELADRDAAVLEALKAAVGAPIVVAEVARSVASHPAFAGLDGDAVRKAVDRSLKGLAEAGLAVLEGAGKGRTARTVETQP
jgi:hypothetical protein